MDGHDPADDPWPPWWHCYPDDDYAAAGETAPGMLGGYYYADDPLELAWQGGEGGGADDVGQAAAVSRSCLRSSSPSPLSGATVPRAPSDDVMAAWLYPIVSGVDCAGTGVNGSAQVPAAAMATGPSEPSMATGSFGTVKSKGKLPSTENRTMFSVARDSANTRSVDDGSGERISRKQLPAATSTTAAAAAGGGSTSRTTRSSAGTHSVTEKRRRCRITERLRTLQQLVPGCDKSNQASTLEQTIQYMKSLQQQLEAMKTTPPAARVYPVVRPAPPPLAATGHQGSMVVAGGGAGGALHVRPAMAAAGTTMVPLFRGTVLPYPHYYYYHHHAVMMPPPPPAAALPPPPVASCGAAHPAAGAAGDHMEEIRSSAELRGEDGVAGRKRRIEGF